MLVIHDALLGSEGKQRQRAVLEAALSSSIDHPNVVATYAYEIKMLGAVNPAEDKHASCVVIQQTGSSVSDVYQLYLVNELCEGGNLKHALGVGLVPGVAAGGVSVLFTLALALDVACGMAHIHARGIVHGLGASVA
ncbi:hypothetical protein TSOC_012497 [Tetrabaena socialis]|uniref:Protein kinase domain-containing protein n=1 Tax=Tetrabaena socialis TaxID=47790 RepID=A0A2J7ZMV5_9CHLO|nr:hypothetical protein TSOC_012497 [Tetrabaena socialis]|eukprot:PNH01601.1 hypothetical protein TSOC_012497 [Tetrabaena socialis]